MADGLGAFRTVRRGDVEMEVNSHAMTSERYLDRSRLGTHEEWEQSSDPRRMGRLIQVQNSVEDNARNAAGAMKHRSSFSSPEDTRVGDAGCISPGCNQEGPLTRKRGDS